MPKSKKQYKQTKSSFQKLATNKSSKTDKPSRTKGVLEIVKLILSLVTELIKLVAALTLIWKSLMTVFIATVWHIR
jgi:hypothetical protein